MKVNSIAVIILKASIVNACWWKKSEQVVKRRAYPVTPSKPRPNGARSLPKPTKAPRRPLIRKSNRKGLPKPPPTDYVGDKPEWEEFKQKGNKCVSTTSAAVPCKDPIPAGGKCKDKYNWSNEGYISSEVQCIKVAGGVKRRELRQECFFRDGQFQCWKHWSTTGCTKTSCQSDKLDNNGMGKTDVKAPW